MIRTPSSISPRWSFTLTLLLALAAAGSATSATVTLGDPYTEYFVDSGLLPKVNAYRFALPQAATVRSIRFLVGTVSGNLNLAIYGDSSNGPGTLVATTGAFPAVAGWNDHPVLQPVTLAPGYYWLAFQPDNNLLSHYTARSGGSGWSVQRPYGPFPTTFPPGGAAHFWQASFYAVLILEDRTVPEALNLGRPHLMSVDDVGWQGGPSLEATGGPYRLGTARDPTLEDYATLVNVSRNVGSRVLGLFILSEFDRNGIMAKPEYNLPLAPSNITEMGLDWQNPYIKPGDFAVMAYMRDNAAWLEFGMHGSRHERWTATGRVRAEWAGVAPGYANWGFTNTGLHAQAFRELFRQYFDEQELLYPSAFVPCAHGYYFNPDADDSTGAILHAYGIKYSNGLHALPPDEGFLDHGVLFLQRDNGPTWSAVGTTKQKASPSFTVHESHFPNWWGAEAAWESWLRSVNNDPSGYLAKNTEQAYSQWIYRKHATLTGGGGDYTLVTTNIPADYYDHEILGTLVVKVPLSGRHVATAAIDNGAQIVAYEEDAYGYGYLTVGHPSNPMGRLSPGTYHLTVRLGERTELPAYVRSSGQTFNVYSLDASSTAAQVRVRLYGSQQVRVDLPFVPVEVASEDPGVTLAAWSFSAPTLALDLSAKSMNGQTAVIRIDAALPPRFETSPAGLQMTASGLLLTLSNLVGHGDIVIYASTNLQSWEPILTNPPTLGSLQVLDGGATNRLRRFYRASEQR